MATGAPKISRRFDQRAILCSNTPDAPLALVASRVIKIHLAVTQNGIVKVENVNRAVGADLDIDGAKGIMAGVQDGFDFARRVAAVLFFDLVSDGPVGAKIVGQQTPLPMVGSMTAGDEFSSGVLRLSGHDHSAQRLLDVGCHPVGDTREAIVRALPASTIGRKRLAPMIKSETPWVGHSTCIDFQSFGLRPEAPDTPAIEAPGSPGGLDETVDVDRLGKVELSPGRPAQSVDKMTGIGFAEAGIHHPAALGMIIAIFVDQMDKLSGAADIGAIGNGHHRIRQQQSLGEEGRPIGATVVIRVFQDNDAVIGGAALACDGDRWCCP